MPETEILSAREWQKLARFIQNGACVLVLGPAIAVDPHDAQHTPLTTVFARALAKRLKEKIGPSCQIVSEDDLAHVSQLFCDFDAVPGFGRMDLETALEEFYSPYDGTTTDLHRELAKLPFQLVINTTPDEHMVNAFKEVDILNELHELVKKRPRAEYYDFRHKRDVSSGLIESPVVFGLYGSRRDPSSLVLTESDLLAFLVRARPGR